MAFKNFFDKLKDKSQDIAQGAKKLVSGPEGEAPIDDGMTIETTPDRPSGSHPRSSVGAPPSSAPSGRLQEPIPPTAPPPMLPPADPNKIAGLAHRGEKSSAPLVVNDANDTVYRKRSSVVDEIEEQFGRFGPRVSTYLLTQLMMPNGMKMLLAKLELRSRGFEGGDKSLVENWIDLNGTDEFAKRVGLRTRDSESSNPVTANLPPETASSSPPADLRIRPMSKKVAGPTGTGTRPGDARSSASVPLPPPSSSKPRAAAPPRPPVAPPPTETARPSADQEPHPADESVKIRPVAISQDAERRASMARSPLPGGADSKSFNAVPPPPVAPPPAPPALPAVSAPVASHIVPPILPPMPLPSPPDMGRSDETEEAPSRFPANFLQNVLDESSRTGPPIPKRPPNRNKT